MKDFMLRGRNGSWNERTSKHNKDCHKNVKPPSFTPRKLTKAHPHEILSEIISET